MFLTKLICPLFLLVSSCVGISQGAIRLYDLMQNSDDDCFDKPGDIYKRKGCYELVEENSGYCYTSIEEFCCLSCSFKKLDISGCEYGDKSFDCDVTLCGRYDKDTRENICCKTCDGVSLTNQISKPTTQKPVTSSWVERTSKESIEIASTKKPRKPAKTFSFPVLKEKKGKRKPSIKHHVEIQKEPEPKYSTKDVTSFDTTADWVDPDPLPVETNQVEPKISTNKDKTFHDNYAISNWENPTEPSQKPQVASVSDTVLWTGSITNSENKKNTENWIDPVLPKTLTQVQVERTERKNSPTLSAPGMSSINHLKDTVLSMPTIKVEPEATMVPVTKGESSFDGSSIAVDIPKTEGSGNGDMISPGFDIKPWDSYAAANNGGGVVSGPTVSPIIPKSNAVKKFVDLTNNPVKIFNLPTPEQNNEYAGKESANFEPQISSNPSNEHVLPVIPFPPYVVEPALDTEPIVPDTPYLAPAVVPILEPPHGDKTLCGTRCHDVRIAPDIPVPSGEIAPVPDNVIIIQEPKKTEASPAVKNILENFINPNEPDASHNVEQNLLPIIPGPKTLGVSVMVDPLALPADLETAIVEGISLRDAMIKIPKDALTFNDPVPFNEPSHSIPFFGNQENSLPQASKISKIKTNIEILPNIEPSYNENIVPVENTIPVKVVEKITTAKTVVPVENVLSVENVLPVENVFPVENLLLVENVKPIENVKPLENVKPIANVIPIEKVHVVDNTILVKDANPVEPVPNGLSSKTKETIKAEKIEVNGNTENIKKGFVVKTITKPSSSVPSRIDVVPAVTNAETTIPAPRTIVIQRPMYMPYSPWFYPMNGNNHWYNPIRSPMNTPVVVRETQHFKIVRTPRKKKKINKKATETVQPISSWNSLHPPISPQPNIRLFSATPTKSQSISDDDQNQSSRQPIPQRKPVVNRQQNNFNVRNNLVSRQQTQPFRSSQRTQPHVFNSHQQRVSPGNSVFHRQQQMPSRNSFNNRHQGSPYNFNQQMHNQGPRLFIHHMHSFNYPNMHNMQQWQNMNPYIQNYKSMNMNHLPFWYKGRW